MKRYSAIIHIGGSQLQLPSLQWAKEAGFYIVLTDMNPSCPGRAIADRFETISGTDVDALLQLAQSINQEHDLVGAYCSNDFGLPAVAEISDTFSLPGPAIAAVQNALEKTRAREIWKREGLPIPKGEQIKTLDELSSLACNINLPLIIKPPDSSGSQGVSSAWQSSDLVKSFERAKKYSRTVLVEELVLGRHIDVNGLIIEGNYYPCGTMERYFSPPPYHYPIWGCDPSSLDPDQEKEVHDLVFEASLLLGPSSGPIKADIIWTEKGPVLLELAHRFHGDVSTAYVMKYCHNNSPIEAWFSYIAGEHVFSHLLPGTPSCHSGYMGIFPEEVGTLSSIENLDEALTIEGIQKIFLRISPGDLIKKHKDNTSLCGFIWATGTSREDIYSKMLKSLITLKFIIEPVG